MQFSEADKVLGMSCYWQLAATNKSSTFQKKRLAESLRVFKTEVKKRKD